MAQMLLKKIQSAYFKSIRRTMVVQKNKEKLCTDIGDGTADGGLEVDKESPCVLVFCFVFFL